MIPYEEFSRLVKEGFANSGITVTLKPGIGPHPNYDEPSSPTQDTTSTPTTPTEIIFGVSPGKKTRKRQS